MSLIFSAGLRRQELLNLKVHDIDMERKVISIHKGKGNKDRISILAETTARHINEYVSQYKPKCWLFEGQVGGQYSAESVWKIFDRLKKRFSIGKKRNVHLLRHTFATNLLETGTVIRYIQKLLGHYSIKTTEVYKHIANNNLLKIKSPIDQLGI
jgi:integrase/recombinase XerD